MGEESGAAGRRAPPLEVEQRERLGLAPEESVRVLAAGPRTLFLERAGGSDAMPLPWDRELALAADVRAFSIADVLGLVHASGKSGFLFFRGGDHEKSVYLHRGEVVFATSNQSVDRLGECLLRMGAISLEQHREARRAYAPPGLFGRILVERGVLTPRELWNGVKAQVEEIVRSLFSYDAGQVLFFDGEVRPDNVVRLSLPTQRLVAEGLRRRDELLRLLAHVEGPRARLERVADADADLSGAERAFHAAIGPGVAFSEVCRSAGVDPLSGARVLNHLRLVGAVRVVERDDAAAGAPGDARSGDAEAVRACVRAHAHLLSELAVPIVAVEGGEALRSRVQRVVDDASRRFPELLGGVAVGPGGAIDPQAAVERALRFPGDREREVRLALGELVAYFEFELVNHPKIAEPELFLEAVEPLRAAL